MRIGMIGNGRIARRFVTEAREAEGVTIPMVLNPHTESAEAFAKSYDIPRWTGEQEVLFEACDAVYIAVPHGKHYSYALAALQAGKHVLCEKPMTLSEEKTRALYALAKERGLCLFEAMKTAYAPGFQAVLSLLKSGKIGEIRDVEAAFTKLTPDTVREMQDRTHGGSVTELGSYVLLPILKLLGTDYRSLQFQTIAADNGVDLYTKLLLSYEQGFACGKVGLGVKTEGQLLVSGTRGYLLVPSPWWLTSRCEIRYEDPNKVERYEFPFEGAGLRYEIRAFRDAVRAMEAGDPETAAGLCMLSPEESAAMSRVMETFLREQRSVRKK